MDSPSFFIPLSSLRVANVGGRWQWTTTDGGKRGRTMVAHDAKGGPWRQQTMVGKGERWPTMMAAGYGIGGRRRCGQCR